MNSFFLLLITIIFSVNVKYKNLFYISELHLTQKKDIISNIKEESMDYDYNQQEETSIDNVSNSYSVLG